MKKILIGALLASSLLYGAKGEKPYSFGAILGVTSIKNTGGLDGLHLQEKTIGFNFLMNAYDNIKPRFDIEYTSLDLNASQPDSLLRISLNAIYEFSTLYRIYPYLIAGAGFERVDNKTKTFSSLPFMQGGAGLKYNIKNSMAINLEMKALSVIGGDKDEKNEAILTAGLSIPFGKIKTPQPKQKPIIDSDGDGVMDELDKCPDTPIGITVDGSGCPLPEPKVTVIEKKIEVPIPMSLDNRECPVKTDKPDRDRDGVEDSIDQCPNTLCDFNVDSKGCPIKAILRIHFETDKADITPYSRPLVKKFADFLLKNKGSQVLITGHTDWRGSNYYNMVLSKKRAESVRKALIEYGVSPSRLETAGKGEEEPIATNKTEEGMAQNRRIEVTLSYPGYQKVGEE